MSFRALEELQRYLQNLDEYTNTHAMHQQVLKDMWGDPKVFDPTPEDKASLFSTFLYTWIYPEAVQASREALTADVIPPSSEALQTDFCGRRLSKAVQKALFSHNAWNSLIGLTVHSKLDSESCGVLRWIGVPQQGIFTHTMAGVEWEKPPKTRELERNGNPEKNPFFNGVAYGEHLFVPLTESMSTLELPSTLEFTVADEFAILPPPTPHRLPLFRCIISTLPAFLIRQIPFSLCGMAANLAGPVLLKMYVAYIGRKDYHPLQGFLIAAALGSTFVAQPILRHRALYMSICSGWQVRSALSCLIFEKSMTLSIKPLAVPTMNPGKIVNMMSSDVERIMQFFGNLDTIWCSPLQLLIAIVMLFNMIGWCSIAGLLIIVVTLPINTYITSLQINARRALSAATDARIKATNEFISGVRVTKYMSWEPHFVSEIQNKRTMELEQLKRIQYCRVLLSFVSNATPTVMIAVVFTLYYALGNELSPTVVFPTLALFNLIRGPFMELPFITNCLIQLQVSLERIKRFLECENTSVTNIKDPSSSCASGPNSNGVDAPVVFQDCNLTAYIPVKLPKVPKVGTPFLIRLLRFFICCEECRPPRKTLPLTAVLEPSSDSKENKKSDGDTCYELTQKNILEDVNVKIPKGKLTVIIGPTGCGKSTLMHSILSQLEVTKGHVMATKSIAYVPQQPWIMNATLRENVLFFAEENEENLKEALQVSQLRTDLDMMPNGLETEIGEKGINLSGGQKARVSLARGVYADRDLYLLDDPLSALDAHVGEKVLRECILGKLSGKTRLLATHHMHVLQHADYIIALQDQRVLFSGERDDFYTSAACSFMAISPITAVAKDSEDREATEKVMEPSLANGLPKNDKAAGHLITQEEKASGSIPFSTYVRYFNYCGGKSAIAAVLGLFAVTEVLAISSTVWLSLWSTDSLGIPVASSLKWYLVLVLVGTISSPLRNFCGFAAMRRGCKRMHQDVLLSVSAATMEFFDVTPIGRIVHRFSRDIDVIDNTLQMALLAVIEYSMAIISSTIVSVISIPVFVVALVPSIFFYRYLLKFYGTASRETRRLLSILKSPVYSLLTEMTNGTSTIQAYNSSSKFLAEANRRLDLVANCANFGALLHRWLGVRVELANAFLISVIAFCGIILSHRSRSNTALISLSLTMAMQMSSTVLRLLRQTVTVESEMNSIERLIHYIDNIPREDLQNSEVSGDQSDYSHKTEAMAVAVEGNYRGRDVVAGSIECEHLQMRYREGLPLVLKDVSFCIAPREKVGIVGRTGSGKSTLLLTFMRMVNIDAGRVLINGSPIQSYPLRTLRLQFSMIPQDPVLFDGTVRQNLDPFFESSEKDIWSAVTLCGLRERIESESGGLEGRVQEGGSNFSVGQRQLLCMARALLRKRSSFILMDEATANIDPTLDRQIQATLMNAFSDYTVITIAHRLHTVATYDKIIVMNQGVVAEVGTPKELLTNRGSLFREMVDAMGSTAAQEVMSLTQQREERRNM